MSIEPITMMKIAQGISVASSVIGMIGNMQAEAYNAAVAERNARLMEENARLEIERSQIEQQDWGDEARGQLGRLMAELGASGMVMGTGSAALRRSGSERLAQRDAERIREEGVGRADEFRQRAADYQGEAGFARRRQGFALLSGVTGALTSYLGHASQINRARGLIS